jgi:hypothetical protein
MASAKGANNPNDPGTWNRYAYVAGDPINRVDPTGRLFELTCGGEDGDSSDCFDIGGYDGGGGDGDWDPGPGSAPAAPPGCTVDSYSSRSGTFYTCFHQSGSDWNSFTKSLARLDKSLQKDPQCDTFLMSGSLSLADINYDLLHPATTFTLAGTIINLAAGGVQAGTTGDVPGQTSIIINSSAFQAANQPTDYLTILHELHTLAA